MEHKIYEVGTKYNQVWRGEARNHKVARKIAQELFCCRKTDIVFVEQVRKIAN